MQEEIRAALEEGEELLWSGRPEEFVTKDRTYGRAIIRNVIIKAVISAAVITGYIALALSRGVEVKTILVILLVLGAAALVYGDFRTANILRKKVCYAVTDRRLILLASELKGISYDRIKTARFAKDEDGHVTLLCGKDAVASSPVKWRGYASSTIRTDAETGECEFLAFYALPEAEKVKNLVKQYLPLE